MSSGIVEQIRAAGGEVYGVTSEPQRLASRAQHGWDLDFECIGDPHQEIPATCRERGWLELFVNDKLDFLRASSKQFDPEHPKGYFQPGVIALSKEGRILYRWRSIPSRKNVGGAIARPTPEHVFSSVERSLAESSDAAMDTDPKLDAPGVLWPLFVSALVANGWFVSPRGFGQRETGPSPQQRIARAFAKILGFVMLWVLGFMFLPKVLVALALAAWIAWIVPKVRWLNAEFQSVETS